MIKEEREIMMKDLKDLKLKIIDIEEGQKEIEKYQKFLESSDQDVRENAVDKIDYWEKRISSLMRSI